MDDVVHGIRVDYSRDSLFDELGKIRLKESYMTDEEKSPQERFAFVSKVFGSNPEHAQRLYEYSSKHWLSYSTPILSYGHGKRGLPISCFADGTIIKTDTGYKNIEDLVVGDKVLSHDGTYNEIEAVRQEVSEDMYELTVSGETFFVTGNHLVLTKEDEWVRVDELDLDRHNIVRIGCKSNNINFSIKKHSSPMRVHDIQVANTNTFTVGVSNMVVHNCFLNYIEDTAEGLVDNLSETNWLSMLGGGVGIGFGIRSADDKSTGVMPHLKIYDASSLAYRQGRTRRGSYAAYLDINHPDIINFLEMRKPTGDQNMRTLNLHHGINIPDSFMEIIERCMVDAEADDSWDLVDPASHEVRETVSAKDLWMRILEMRMQTGEPYLHFIDESNRQLPQWLKDKGLKVRQSNLCLTGDSLINVTIDDGSIEKHQLVDVIEQVNAGKNVTVESKNLTTGEIEYKKISAGVMTAKSATLMQITDEETGKTIRCTPDHKIYTKNRGYVMGKELKEDDVLDLI